MDVAESKIERVEDMERSGFSSVASDGERGKPEGTPKSMSGHDPQPPFAPASVQQTYTQRDLSQQNDFHRHMYITQEESHIE